jgi:hypothetical protein
MPVVTPSKIPLRARDGSVRAIALVDAADVDALNQWRWSLQSAGYAQRHVRSAGRQHIVLMHRALLGLAYGDPREVDHINRNKLDCRRANLRIVTRGQNAQNMVRPAATSAYRGVCWSIARRKWLAYCRIDYRQHNLGAFDEEEDAAAAARAFRLAHMTHNQEDDHVVA